MSNTRWMTLVGMILVAALTRLLPHPSNISPIAAMALFGGATFADRRSAFLIPLAAMFVSDLVLGFHALMPLVYFCFITTVMLGRWIRTRHGVRTIIPATLASALFFFLVTNFGVWATSGMYPMTASGLFTCYIAAVPFFQSSLIGDFTSVAVLFGGFSLLEKWVPTLRTPNPA